MTNAERERFDGLFERVFEALPVHIHEMLERVPVIVEDRPSAKLRQELGLRRGDHLYGLHTGVPLTERSVEGSAVPGEDHILIFRESLIALARGDHRRLEEEIRITLLHEIGHHFGLDEDDLADLGYA